MVYWRREMTNYEFRMSKEIQNPKTESLGQCHQGTAPRMTRIRADKYLRVEPAHPRVSASSAVEFAIVSAETIRNKQSGRLGNLPRGSETPRLPVGQPGCVLRIEVPQV
jgi:hypothetical protein